MSTRQVTLRGPCGDRWRVSWKGAGLQGGFTIHWNGHRRAWFEFSSDAERFVVLHGADPHLFRVRLQEVREA